MYISPSNHKNQHAYTTLSQQVTHPPQEFVVHVAGQSSYLEEGVTFGEMVLFGFLDPSCVVGWKKGSFDVRGIEGEVQ